MLYVVPAAELIGVFGWMWGVVGGIVGTVLGVTGAAIGVYSSRRVARGEENLLRMKKWNLFDSFYTFLIVVGLLFLTAGLFFIRSEIMEDGYALSLFSLGFLLTGCLNAIIRVRSLY